MPRVNEFCPAGFSGQWVTLTIDEYETIRLIDKEGFSQEECAGFMQVARTTVQQIYNAARRKIAGAIVEGVGLRIEGGSYMLCSGEEAECGCGGCPKHRRIKTPPEGEKRSHTMKVAVTYENGQIFQHFGHTEQFKIYEVEEGKIVSSQVIDTNGSGHGALAGLLAAQKVDVLICGGIGGGAQTALAQAGIRLFGGVQGDADKAAADFAAGVLSYDPDAKCDHHEHSHGEGHTCGEHGCGGHDCH